MGIFHGLANFGSDEEGLRDPHGEIQLFCPLHDGMQVLADEVFHGDEIAAVKFAEVVDMSNIFVLQQGRELGFGDKMGNDLGIQGKLGQELFDDDDLLKAFRTQQFAFEHLGHAAHANAIKQCIFLPRFCNESPIMDKYCLSSLASKHCTDYNNTLTSIFEEHLY